MLYHTHSAIPLLYEFVYIPALKVGEKFRARSLKFPGLVAGGQNSQKPNDVGIVKKELVKEAQKDQKGGRNPAPDLDLKRASQD